MRFVIFGAGALGGVVGARQAQAGFAVALIARGAHLEAIRRDGLRLETPAQETVLELPAAEDPTDLGVGAGDDVVLLTTKTQDTPGALASLRRATGSGTPVMCLQNGVENERLVLRTFDAVYGAVVMLPAAHLEAGTVSAYGSRVTGIVDIGCYPAGTDELCEVVTEALAASGFIAHARADIMRFKYAKLILNLGNVVGALCGTSTDSDELIERARREGETALAAAGIEFQAPDVSDLSSRWERLGVSSIGDRPRAGSSSWQSLARRTGTIETDYLNGEIVLLGRLHGVPTPVNAALCELAARHAHRRAAPGELGADEVVALAAEAEGSRA